MVQVLQRWRAVDTLLAVGVVVGAGVLVALVVCLPRLTTTRWRAASRCTVKSVHYSGMELCEGCGDRHHHQSGVSFCQTALWSVSIHTSCLQKQLSFVVTAFMVALSHVSDRCC